MNLKKLRGLTNMSSKDQIDLLLEKGDLLSKILEITDMENYLAERKLKLRERLEEIENGKRESHNHKS